MNKHRDIAVIGDHFMRAQFFAREIQRACGEEIVCRCLDLPWPDTPMISAPRNGGGGLAEISEYCGTPEQVIAHVGASDILITHLAPITREVFAACPQLKFLAVARGGPLNVDMNAAKARGVVVVNAPGRNASAVAEFTVGVMIAQSRNVIIGHEAMRAGVFRNDLYDSERMGAELSEMTVGIVGYGEVGKRTVKLLRAFGGEILACDPHQTLTPEDESAGVQAVALDELLRRADIVSLHQRASGETAGMFNRARLLSMRPNALLINTARGALLDYDALYEVMKSGRLRGAVLDVFAEEPPPPNAPLLRLRNVTATPHISGASLTTARISARRIAADLQRWMRGVAPRNALAGTPT